jgi:hypothetical protein
MNLIPYVEYNGSWSLTDVVMEHIWEEMTEHGLDKLVFSSNEMKDADEFVKFLKHPRNHVHTIWDDDNRISIIAWVNDLGSNCAFAHFCCFPHTWGTTSVEIGKQSLGHWFGFKHGDNRPVFGVILGRIPASNEKAIDYAKKCGMTEVGRIPGILYGDKIHDTSFLYITREQYYGR